MCVAAIPVEAVIATFIPAASSQLMYWLMTKVLPAPGSPVKNTFAPVLRISNARS